MTKEKAVSLLSQMFLIQFSKEEHEALAMAIEALNNDCKTEPQTKCSTCETYWNCQGQCDEMPQIEDESQICDTCKYSNSYIPCGSTPSACAKADKFAKEFVDGLKKLEPKVKSQTSGTPYKIETSSICKTEL